MNPLYWIWLSCVLGQGSRKFSDIIEKFGSAEEFYKSSADLIALSGCFSRSQAQDIKSVSLDIAKKISEKCEKSGQNILTYDSENYPELLKNIYSPPAVLYIKGKLPDMDKLVGIAVVGSRKCTAYGYEAAYLLGYRLSKAGAVIVSGGANGIDTAAHKGCLEAKGTTVAVLACGIDVKYLVGNTEMRERISKTGALISEYPPGTGVKPYHFHPRNRIISALSRGTVVVEAGVKSGSLITANHAAEQGKDIFALPGNIQSPFSVGTNRLIKDGAFAVDCPADILCQYAPMFPNLINMKGADVPLFEGSAAGHRINEYQPQKNSSDTYSRQDKDKINRTGGKEKKTELKEIHINKTNKTDLKAENIQKAELPESISGQAKKIFSVFKNGALTTDDIFEITGLSTGEILRGITELELYGFITSLPGGRYVKI